MTQNPDEGWQSLAEVTAKIINTYLTNNHASVTAEELPKLVRDVKAALEPHGRAAVEQLPAPIVTFDDDAERAAALDAADRMMEQEAARVEALRSEPEIIPPHKPILHPAVPIGTEITSDYIVCLEEGKRCRSMKGHLRAKHGLTPEQYRKKWGLPESYSMVPPNYSAVRRQISNQVWKNKRR